MDNKLKFGLGVVDKSTKKENGDADIVHIALYNNV